MDPESTTVERPSDLLIREQQPVTFWTGDRGSVRLVEAGTSGDDLFNEDGTVNVVLLRPCKGRGPAGVGGPSGNRIYTPEVLERDAGVFTGWTCFDNHEAPAARRARQNLPRPPSEIAGEIQASWWEPGITSPEDAKLGMGPGGVVAKFMPATDLVESLIRRVPNSLRWSINGQATGLRRDTAAGTGDPGWLVEGIEDDPENSSFDMVTKAGAGGRVKALIESLADGDGHSSLGGGYDDGHGDRGDLEELDMGGMTLTEALQTDEVKGYLNTLVEAQVNELKPALQADALAQVRAEVGEELAGARWLRLSAQAARLIEATKLPETFKADLREAYGVQDDGDKIVPGDRLALVEAETDAEEKVTKTAADVLKDRIDEDVKRERRKLTEASPTVPTVPSRSGGDGGDAAVPGFGGKGSAWGDRARAMGMTPEKLGAFTPKPPAGGQS